MAVESEHRNGIPQAARRSVLLVFNAILNGDRKQRFTHEFVQNDLQIAQYRQTRALLSFLKLLGADDRLMTVLNNCRSDRPKFTRLLKKRIEDGYRSWSIPPGVIWNDNKVNLKKKHPGGAINTKAWKNAMACILALRELIDKECREEWLKSEINRIENEKLLAQVKVKEQESPPKIEANQETTQRPLRMKRQRTVEDADVKQAADASVPPASLRFDGQEIHVTNPRFIYANGRLERVEADNAVFKFPPLSQ